MGVNRPAILQPKMLCLQVDWPLGWHIGVVRTMSDWWARHNHLAHLVRPSAERAKLILLGKLMNLPAFDHGTPRG